MSLSACASYLPTGYRPAGDDDSYGYKITMNENGIHTSSYHGNQNTQTNDAFIYTMLAAYQTCRAAGKTAIVVGPEDMTQKTSHTEVSSMMTPIYNSNGTTSYTTQSYAYPVTRTYPAFYSAFSCKSQYKVLTPGILTEDIGRELVHPVTKDFKGGILIKGQTSEAKSIKPFAINDVIIRVNGERVETDLEQSKIIAATLDSVRSLGIEVIRKEKKLKLEVTLEDMTAQVKTIEKETIKMLCKNLSDDPHINIEGRARKRALPSICGN